VESIAGEAAPGAGEDVAAPLCPARFTQARHPLILNENDHSR
jgi:hypothetical protein